MAYTSCNSLLVACIVSIVRRVLLSPHTTSTCNASYASYKVFPWNRLARREVASIQCTANEISFDFDLLFISIHAFKDLMDKHPNQLQQWNIKNIFIDEYHNIFGELFRHTNSWTSLRNLARHSIKITLLSATANPCPCLVIISGWEAIKSLGS